MQTTVSPFCENSHPPPPTHRDGSLEIMFEWDRTKSQDHPILFPGNSEQAELQSTYLWLELKNVHVELQRGHVFSCACLRENANLPRKEREEEKKIANYEGSRECPDFLELTPSSHEARLPMSSMRATASWVPSSKFPFMLKPN